MNKRPTAVLVLGWLFIAVGGVAFLYHASELDPRHPFEQGALWACGVRVLAIIGGVFLLRGCNWARWLLAAWMAFHLILSAFHSLGELGMHAVLFGIIGYFLFRPRTSAFFRKAAVCLACLLSLNAGAQTNAPRYRVIAFYTGKGDKAHISFITEANRWFPRMAAERGFTFESTTNWVNLTSQFLANYEVVVFLDTRPDAPAQREAFQKYMEKGGAWMGFHFAAFALTPSQFPQNWNWYHNEFLGAGSYSGNTWRPTSAILKVEDPRHPATRGLPETFKASPNEWYKWTSDLRTNRSIKILASIDPASFPLGTGPKQHEIWRSGYYPVVWTNQKYRMIYFNMGHNDLDYENKTNKELSFTFDIETQNRMILNALEWLGAGPGRAH